MQLAGDRDAVAEDEAEIREVRPVVEVVSGELPADLAGDLAGEVVAGEDCFSPYLEGISTAILSQKAIIVSEVRIP